MTVTKTCNTCKHYPNDKHCVGCEWDKSKGENSKWELEDNPIVIDRKVLEQIRAEIQATMDMYEGCEYIGDKARRDELWHVLEIIDKHIGGAE